MNELLKKIVEKLYKKLAEEMENEGLKDNLTSTLGLLSKGFSLA